MKVVDTRPVLCPKCQTTHRMALDKVRGSGSIIFCCPNCHYMASSDEMKASGPSPLSSEEIANYMREIGAAY